MKVFSLFATRSFRLWVILAGATFAGAGCSRPEVPEFHSQLVPVTGKVLLKDEPLAGAAVTFIPTGVEAVRAAYGLTDAEGNYTLMTPIHGLSADKSMGAVPGSYQVMISKLVMADGTELPEGLSHADAMQKGAKEIVPQKFSSQSSSLTAQVTGESTPVVVNFTLK